jgi:hypothetical protein
MCLCTKLPGEAGATGPGTHDNHEARATAASCCPKNYSWFTGIVHKNPNLYLFLLKKGFCPHLIFFPMWPSPQAVHSTPKSCPRDCVSVWGLWDLPTVISMQVPTTPQPSTVGTQAALETLSMGDLPSSRQNTLPPSLQLGFHFKF